VQAEQLERRDRIEDQVKNLNEKLGVASREELVDCVFLDECRLRSRSRHRHVARALRPRIAGLQRRAFRTGKI
jgi:hypothetical protein